MQSLTSFLREDVSMSVVLYSFSLLFFVSVFVSEEDKILTILVFHKLLLMRNTSMLGKIIEQITDNLLGVTFRHMED